MQSPSSANRPRSARPTGGKADRIDVTAARDGPFRAPSHARADARGECEHWEHWRTGLPGQLR
jgi:hypothetical protein